MSRDHRHACAFSCRAFTVTLDDDRPRRYRYCSARHCMIPIAPEPPAGYSWTSCYTCELYSPRALRQRLSDSTIKQQS